MPFNRMAVPTATLRVAPGQKVQDAVSAATPGTAIMVAAGAYPEAVQFPSRRGGAPDAPIWLISADGPGAASVLSIKGLAAHDVAVQGMATTGGENGIQFGMSGDPAQNPEYWSDPARWCRNILIERCRVTGASGDGIKISQAEDVEVVGNFVSDVGGQCVDFVAVHGGSIARNDLSRPGKTAALFVKGGSSGVLVEANFVHDVPGGLFGIQLGGFTTLGYVPPGCRDFEAADLVCRSNDLRGITGTPISVNGARDCSILLNTVDGAACLKPLAFVGVGRGGNGTLASRITVAMNRLAGPTRMAEVMTEKTLGTDGRLLVPPETVIVRDNARAAPVA